VRIILVEFPWQVKEIINNKETFKKDVIVSLDPESSYILKTNEISYFETYEICNHKELWLKYKEITNRSIKITEALDEALWNTDKRFKDLNWKLFNDYHYPFKISFDQLFYYSELISELIEKFNPSEIIVADTKKILINDYFFVINSKISVIKYLLKTLEGTFNRIKISFVLPEKNEKSIVLFFNNIKKNKFFIIDFIKAKIKNIYYKINFTFNYYTSRPKYLSIGCYEILRYKKLYPNESKFFLSYHHDNLNKKSSINNLTFFNKFVDYLKNKTNFYELIKHKNISFKLVFHEILLKLTKQFDFLINEHNKAKKIINRVKPSCVIFQTATPFYSPNVTFRKICIDYKIPCVVWMHGGYGLTYSFSAYDVTDFRFFKNHITYGPFLEKIITNEKCVLKKLNFQKNYKLFTVGSNRLDHDNRNHVLNNNIIASKKHTLLFMSGCQLTRNQFYFGYNREKNMSSLWHFHYEILKLLKKYQDKYNIIFKDYPNRSDSLWKRVLKDINATQISFISNQKTVNDLLQISDLNIFPWLTTAFFEALYFDADIFGMEEDLFSKHFSQKLNGELFCFNSEVKFIQELEKYLEVGKFYKCKKNNSKSYFINFNNLHNKNKLLNKALNIISNNQLSDR
jgi:hypothetical protein|tara:strand:+ start:849 stop:2732 length:1884 start_codon:yes stop_codon:yes gene_type:complete